MMTKWNAVYPETNKEKADIGLVKAQTDVQLSTAGAVDAIDIRKRLITDPDSGYDGIEEQVEGWNLANEAAAPEGGGDGDEDATAQDGGAATRQATDEGIKK